MSEPVAIVPLPYRISIDLVGLEKWAFEVVLDRLIFVQREIPDLQGKLLGLLLSEMMLKFRIKMIRNPHKIRISFKSSEWLAFLITYKTGRIGLSDYERNVMLMVLLKIGPKL